MTTKKNKDPKSSTVQALDLSDLDGIVGGATSPAPAAHPHDPSQDQAFLATLGNVAAVVSTAATAVSSGHETAQTAINTVEAAAQAQHISTTAALTDLLGATHGNQTVATALTTGLVNGSSEAELANLGATGHLQVQDINTIVSSAAGTLAAYSKDGHSALGMSQNAAIDVIDAKIDTAAHTQSLYDMYHGGFNPAGLLHGGPLTSGQLSSDVNFTSAFESQNASQLTAAQSIINLEGGATAFQAGLNAVESNPLQAQSAGVFGETASLADAFSGQASSALVNQILASSNVVSQLAHIAGDATLTSTGLGALESAAAAAHVSTDLTLSVAESLAQTSAVQQTLATEMTSRLVSGAAETELANLGATGHLQVQDINTIVSSAAGTLAGLSADGHSALGMPQNAAIDVIDAKIDTAAHTQSLYDMYHGGFNPAGLLHGGPLTSGQLSSDVNFTSAFESQNASQLAASQSIINLEGGATAFQAGLNAVVGNPLQAQNASVFGETASLADAFSGQANSALVNQILASSAVVSQLAQVAGDTTLTSAGISALESAAAAAHVSTDLTLQVAESIAQTSAIQQTLATEMTSRLVSGTAETELANLGATGHLQVQDVNTIVSSVTGTLAGLSADGHSALGMSQNAAIDVIDAKIDTAAHTVGQNQLTTDQSQLALYQNQEASYKSYLNQNLPGSLHSAAETLLSRAEAALPGAEAAVQSDQAAVSNATNFANTFESQNASHLTAAQSIINLEGGASAFQAGLNAVVGHPLQAQNASAFGETATIVEAFAGHATSALVSEILAASNATSGAAAINAIEGVSHSQSNGQTSTDLALALADEFSTNKGVQQVLDTELTTRLNNGLLQVDIVTLAHGQQQLRGGQDVTNIISTVTGVLASHSADGNTVAGTTQAAASAALYANIDSQINTEAANYITWGNSLLSRGNFGGGLAAYIEGGVLAQFAQAFETSHGTDILTGIGLDIATKSAQADIQVHDLQQAPASTAASIANAITSGFSALTGTLTGTAAQIAQIEQTAQTAIQADLAQAQHITTTLAGQAYNAAGGAATISTVSSGVHTALDATTNAADAALNKGFDLAVQTKSGRIADDLINSPPTTLAGFVNVGAEVEGQVIGGTMAKQLLGGRAFVLAAEGMDYLLGQSAVANVLGSHATGDLKTACDLITTVNSSIQLFAGDLTHEAGTVLTSEISVQVDLAKNIGSLGNDLFTGNFSDMKGDAQHLASQFLTDVKSLGSTIGSASSALVNDTASILGNTMNSMYSIISSNPDVQAAVSWVSNTGEKIDDVLKDAGSDIENFASSTVNTLKNFGDDVEYYANPLHWF